MKKKPQSGDWGNSLAYERKRGTLPPVRKTANTIGRSGCLVYMFDTDSIATLMIQYASSH